MSNLDYGFDFGSYVEQENLRAWRVEDDFELEVEDESPFGDVWED